MYKVGDKVICKKAHILNQTEKNGEIVEIKYDPNYKGPYFYRVSGVTRVHHMNNPRGYVTWSCNIFPHLSDEIRLDAAIIRQDKLNQLI